MTESPRDRIAEARRDAAKVNDLTFCADDHHRLLSAHIDWLIAEVRRLHNAWADAKQGNDQRLLNMVAANAEFLGRMERAQAIGKEALEAWEPEHEYYQERAARKGYSHDETAAQVYGLAIEVVNGILGALYPAAGADTAPLKHTGGNAEDCPVCSRRTDLPYPFICPGEPDGGDGR